jgi:hypothetical protein
MGGSFGCEIIGTYVLLVSSFSLFRVFLVILSLEEAPSLSIRFRPFVRLGDHSRTLCSRALALWSIFMEFTVSSCFRGTQLRCQVVKLLQNCSTFFCLNLRTLLCFLCTTALPVGSALVYMVFTPVVCCHSTVLRMRLVCLFSGSTLNVYAISCDCVHFRLAHSCYCCYEVAHFVCLHLNGWFGFELRGIYSNLLL